MNSLCHGESLNLTSSCLIMQEARRLKDVLESSYKLLFHIKVLIFSSKFLFINLLKNNFISTAS